MTNINIKAVICVLALVNQPYAWSSQYTVNIDTTSAQGLAGTISLDFTSNAPFTNSVFILNFIHDGVSALPVTSGGLVQGDIILLLNPAPFTSLADGFFYNELSVPFTSFGTNISFVLQTTEVGPFFEDIPDEVSFFAVGENGQSLFNTSDPLGADSIFSLCIDGTPPGLLNVHEPAVFTPATNTISITLPFGPNIFGDGFE